MAQSLYNIYHHNQLFKKKNILDVFRRREKTFFDYFMYVIGLSTSVVTLPQVYNVWILHNTSGISLISWLSYAILSVFWIIYGIIRKEKIVLFNSTGLFIVNFAVALGVILK
ncbi:PQ-loop domain-containing transporter [Patescibacteria group bacterium]|nr:PQ-loop domain-containing transporter [Patescibacteria group bacterium]